MMKRRPWKLFFALFLIGLSALFHFVHYLIFGDAHHIFIYLLGDIAFVPISVLFVTLILEHLLERQQKETMAHKLNMVLSAFFSEVGNPLIKELQALVQDNPALIGHLQVAADWSLKDFVQAKKFVRHQNAAIDARRLDLGRLKDFLVGKRGFLLALLENPNLLEHEQISDMLWAIFHLTEELIARNQLNRLGEKDLEHLSGDCRRVFSQLLLEWIDYMRHLKIDYPYLYSLAVRLNPFNPEAHAEIS